MDQSCLPFCAITSQISVKWISEQVVCSLFINNDIRKNAQKEHSSLQKKEYQKEDHSRVRIVAFAISIAT